MQSWSGKLQTTYTKSGSPRYEIEIGHQGLNQHQVIRDPNSRVAESKARAKMQTWNETWARRQAVSRGHDLAAERTEEAQELQASLERILPDALETDNVLDFEALKDHSSYPAAMPELGFSENPPRKDDLLYKPRYGCLRSFWPPSREKTRQEAETRFQKDYQRWESSRNRAQEEYENAKSKWEAERDEFLRQRDTANAAIDSLRQEYSRGTNPQAIMQYCELVLSQSQYPDFVSQVFELDYRIEAKILVVDYQLPALNDMPTLLEVKYIQSRNEHQERHLTSAAQVKAYESLLYRMVLRVLHELFSADVVGAIDMVVVNGYVSTIDPATGKPSNPCILTVQANKQEFSEIRLENVDPKACFKKLKGLGASRLSSLTPVAPLMRIDKEDRRFVASYDVANQIEGENLAAMDWEDFEHLIREMFEKEFASTGGEVRVTRASRDGGIDAVIFDPDPLRGGKIVVQAKRCTNTVGVAAVRDLYGTLINEGANKGILVSTADYGPDAHEFARGKPITLLSGSELLYLLEKHGHKARIDLREAKEIIADRDK